MIGIEDKSHDVYGVEDPLDAEERLANLISDKIDPRLLPSIEIHPWRNTHLVAVEVFPGSNRPYYVSDLGPERGVYVRVGSTNRKADRALIDELRRAVKNQTYDEEALPELNSEAIDYPTISELFAELRTIKRSDLQTLRLLIRHQGKTVPTVGGVILFGRERERYFPDAWIQCGRFKGLDKRQILDSYEARDYPPLAVEQVMDFVKKHALRGISINSARHEEKWNVPLLAVREAIINAVVHADYSQSGSPIRVAFYDDRLEIENPGLLPLGLTINDIIQGISKLRNRVIGRVFKELGLIEQWGSGIQRMLAACLEMGLEEPSFEEIANHFRVTLFTRQQRAQQLDETDRIICTMLGESQGLSTHEIASRLALSDRAVRNRLSKLTSKGIIRAIGTSPRDPHRRYFLTVPTTR